MHRDSRDLFSCNVGFCVEWSFGFARVDLMHVAGVSKRYRIFVKMAVGGCLFTFYG